ncbi:hypothetical protein HT594_00080 [Phenacoccus solenopsis nudivirus]|nr:hypothetical protein HT594_00080 [Phenacoccus solenopsis nudivirus]
MSTNQRQSTFRNLQATAQSAIFRDCDNMAGPLKRASMISLVCALLVFGLIVFIVLFNRFYKGAETPSREIKSKVIHISSYITIFVALLTLLATGYMYPNVRKAIECAAPTTQ